MEKVKEAELETPEKPVTKDKYVFQYLVALSATLFSLSVFAAFAWSSSAIPKLLSEDSPIHITSDQSSWIVSLMQVGIIIVPICAAWMMDKFGRKRAMLMGCVPLLISWVLVGVAESIVLIYVSRVLSGFSYGIAFSVLPMYLGEIASDRIRGSISILMGVMAAMGTLYAFSIGPYVTFKMTAWLFLIPPLIFIGTFIWLPESPYYLLGKGQEMAARKSLSRLRQHNDVDEELNKMSIAVKKSQENRGTFRELFMNKGNRMSFIIILGLGAVIQLCGSQAITAYAQTIFERVGSSLRASEASIVLAVVKVVSASVASLVVDIVGRRPLLLASVIGAAMCNTTVGLYFFLERMEIDVSGIAWLPMLAIMVYIVTYTIGMTSVTFAILGEIFPKNLKAVAGASYTVCGAAFGFAVTKLFQVVSDDLGSDVAFWGFAFFTYLFIPFVWFLIPETKGKPLDVILDEINLRNRKKSVEVKE